MFYSFRNSHLKFIAMVLLLLLARVIFCNYCLEVNHFNLYNKVDISLMEQFKYHQKSNYIYIRLKNQHVYYYLCTYLFVYKRVFTTRPLTSVMSVLFKSELTRTGTHIAFSQKYSNFKLQRITITLSYG